MAADAKKKAALKRAAARRSKAKPDDEASEDEPKFGSKEYWAAKKAAKGSKKK